MLTMSEEVKTMRAAQGKDYGDIDEMISVEDHVKYPSLEDIPAKKRKNLMIIKTYAVALACGDCRVLSGLTRELQGPPSFPYIPCGDCSGIVVEIPKDVDDFPFKIGDRVAARFLGAPRDALAEYAVIHQAVCEKVPENVSSEDAAALASASPAVLLAERIQPGERVLILGAGGGVGSHVVQLMRDRGASFIAGVSRSPDRLLAPPLSYDRAIDYTKEEPFDIAEFKEEPFDVIMDLASGGWPKLIKDYQSGTASIVKPASMGGRFLTVTPDNAIFEMHSIPPVLKLFLFTPLWRAIKSRLWGRWRLPKYTFAMSLPDDRAFMTKTMDLASKGTLKAVIDPRGKRVNSSIIAGVVLQKLTFDKFIILIPGPFPFATEGVREAFRLQKSRHIHGKVIVQVSK
jgi:NADPH:quinone reductase-like Zn-dependent oxidoreductase